MELGMIHRGEHSEITTVAGATVDSELSGNMIDICPVGALTSKPFRYSARTWELSRRKSVSPHDGVGANLVVQVKAGRVMRVVPLENEAVNECWIADRDRFSYEALHAPSRLTQPMIKQGGAWSAVDWNTALSYVADGLKRVKAEFGVSGIGAIGHAGSTLEELHLLARLVRGLGSESVDHRTRHQAPGNLAGAGGARWLGRPLASLSTLQRALVVGSALRKDHPLMALRLRHAQRHGAEISSLDAAHDDWAMPLAHRLAAAPDAWPQVLAAIASAVALARGVPAPCAVPPGLDEATAAAAQAVAASLLAGQAEPARKAVLLGQAAAAHPQASLLLALADFIGVHTGASVGYLGGAGQDVGAQLAGAVPGPGGLSAAQMLAQPMKALLLLHTEPLLDSADPAAARRALQGSGLVVALTAFRDLDLGLAEVADVLLPVAPFTETPGAFVNAEGRLQPFHAVARPPGEARPAWKVLRVLGNLLDLPGFDQDSVEQVRALALGGQGAEGIAARLDNRPEPGVLERGVPAPAARAPGMLQRVGEVPIYATDPLVRRAPALQATADAAAPVVGLPSALWQSMKLAPGARFTLPAAQGQGTRRMLYFFAGTTLRACVTLEEAA